MPTVCLIDGVNRRRWVELSYLTPTVEIPIPSRLTFAMATADPARTHFRTATFRITNETDDMGMAIYRQRL